jgi:carboxyl-terminal processing protease
MSAASRTTARIAAPRVVDQVRLALASRYYRPVPDQVLQLHSVSKIISALGDPYTTYLAPDAYRLVRQETSSAYGGIAVGVLPSPRGLVVASLRDGPARRAGVRVGDTIVRIDDVATSSLSPAAAMARILGRPGAPVRLQLVRGGERIDVRVRRERIEAPTVGARLMSFAGRRWGDVQLSSFRAGAAIVLRRELRSLERQGAAGLVLDLRDNPGGLLRQAVAVSSLFLDKGVVVSLTGAHQPRRVLHVLPGFATRLPVVVLVDRYTASSAEIVAAALRDNHRATVVGERTFGKALVQMVDRLDNGAALELTIAQYRTPSGQDLSGSGLTPQIAAVDDTRTKQDEALGVALRVLARPTS